MKGNYINGQWRPGTGADLHSINPANGSIIWQGNESTQDEVTAAFEGAQSALLSWKQLGYSGRVHYLLRFAHHVEEKKQALTQLIALEAGKPLWEALTEVNSVIAKIKLSISAFEERCPDIATGSNILRYKPHGVVAVLGPFNFPAHLSNGHIVPALLAGNTVVYKPSELTPAVAELIMQCWQESELPSGVLQCIQGGATVAKSLLNQDIQGVFFTGSYQTGVQINQQFSDRPEVILALEMGGNNPLVIDDVNDTLGAVYLAILSTMLTAGQRCTCARRLIIANNSKGDSFLNQFIKSSQALNIGPFTKNPEPFMGPVIRYEHALSHLEKQKALINAGGQSLLAMSLLKANTGFLSPGIIDMTNVKHPADEEIFAPLVQVYRYDDFEQALSLANQTRYGLAAGLFSDSLKRYQQFYDTIHAGLINWNSSTTGASSALPFGGIGKSGNHRPSAYFAADYCAYPIASVESPILSLPQSILPGFGINVSQI